MQDIDFKRGAWAVVTAVGGKKYIGYFDMKEDQVIESWEKGSILCLFQTFEFSNVMMPVRDQQGNQGMQRLSQCSPPNNCISPDGIWLKPGDIQFFGDMKEENLARHKGLVEQAMAQSMGARAQSAGLVIPTPHVPDPRGRLPT